MTVGETEMQTETGSLAPVGTEIVTGIVTAVTETETEIGTGGGIGTETEIGIGREGGVEIVGRGVEVGIAAETNLAGRQRDMAGEASARVLLESRPRS